jgi:hypothetical protein
VVRAGAKKRYSDVAWYLLSTILTGGLRAAPFYAVFAGLAHVPGISKIFDKLIMALFGSDDPEEDLYATLGKLSPALEMTARQGIPGSLLNISMQSSLSIELPNPMNTPVYAMYRSVQNLIRLSDEGDNYRMLEALPVFPNAMIDIMRAHRERTRISSVYGNQLYFGEEPLHLNNIEAYMRAAGIRSARVAEVQYEVYRGKLMVKKYDNMKDAIYGRYRNYYLKGKDDPQKLENINNDTKEFNERIKRLGYEKQISGITNRSIRQSVAQKPTRFEKGRKITPWTQLYVIEPQEEDEGVDNTNE